MQPSFAIAGFKKFVIAELLDNASHRKKVQIHSQQKEYDRFDFDDLPCINNVESLVQFDNKIKTDKIYRNKVVSEKKDQKRFTY